MERHLRYSKSIIDTIAKSATDKYGFLEQYPTHANRFLHSTTSLPTLEYLRFWVKYG
jgi:hypothetical protein